MSKKKRRTAQNVQNKPAVKQENTAAKEKTEDITDKLPSAEAAKKGEAKAADRTEDAKSAINEEKTGKPKASKGIIAGFTAMGAVIV